MSGDLFAKCGCQNCGGHIEFPIEAAGTGIACPHCQQPTELSLIAPPPASDKLSAVELLAAFTGPIAPARTSLFYQIGLVLVTVTMLLLPVLYLAMIATAGWGIYLFATHCSSVLNPVPGGSRLFIVQLILYFGPIFIGLVLVFFMVKPLFAPRARKAQPLAMDPGVQSTLYAFIAKICDTVGAPMPKRIDLNCELNAAAGFRRGPASFLGNDLVLVIGLPLVAGLNLTEFAGVIAHEFGHFTQGIGMRLSYVIRGVNGWFERVVFERDAWDLWLVHLSEDSEEWAVMLVAGCARAAVGFSRLLLRLLMYLGHGVSCFLLREMEYNADTYEIKLAGSAAFETTERKLVVLNEALKQAYKQMRAAWNLSKALPDNFPAYLTSCDSQIPPAVRERIQDTMGLGRTGLFHTHPSNGDRIRRARQAGEPGIFHFDSPATMLFANFEIVAGQITMLHYADDLEIEFDPSMLRPVAAPRQAQVA